MKPSVLTKLMKNYSLKRHYCQRQTWVVITFTGNFGFSLGYETICSTMGIKEGSRMEMRSWNLCQISPKIGQELVARLYSLPKARSETAWTADSLFCIQFQIWLWNARLWHVFLRVGTALHLWDYSWDDFPWRSNQWNDYLEKMGEVLQTSLFSRLSYISWRAGITSVILNE